MPGAALARWMKYNLCVKRFTEMTALVSIKAAVSWELGLAGLVLQNMIVSCQDQEGEGGIKFLVLVSRVLARWHAAQHMHFIVNTRNGSDHSQIQPIIEQTFSPQRKLMNSFCSTSNDESLLIPCLKPGFCARSISSCPCSSW